MEKAKDEKTNSVKKIRLIELGSADAIKTKIFLQKGIDMGIDFSYHPLDFSEEFIEMVPKNIPENLECHPIVGSWWDDWGSKSCSMSENEMNCVLMKGQSILNLGSDEETIRLLKKIQDCLKKDDLCIFGADLRKDNLLVRKAYED